MKPLIVEYVSAAIDGEGRLYAGQSCAQRLPRMLRAILFGSTHTEVEKRSTLRTYTAGVQVHIIAHRPLRDALFRSFRIDCPASRPNEMTQNDVKFFSTPSNCMMRTLYTFYAPTTGLSPSIRNCCTPRRGTTQR